MTTKTNHALSKSSKVPSESPRPVVPPPAAPADGYFRRASAEFAAAWRGEPPGMGAWCVAF